MAESNKPNGIGARSQGSAPVPVSGPTCDYIPNIPRSPNVDFSLTSTQPYEAPHGGAVDIELKCDIAFEDIEIGGQIALTEGTTQSNIYHFQQTWIVGGRKTLDPIGVEGSMEAIPTMGDANHRFHITIESEIEVLTDIHGEYTFKIGVEGELGHYPKVEATGHLKPSRQDIIASSGELATLSFIHGESTLTTQSIRGILEGEEHPAISGENVLGGIQSESGIIEVLSQIRGNLRLQTPSVEGTVDVLYNIEGKNHLGVIKSESGEIEQLVQVSPTNLTLEAPLSGKLEFIGTLNVSGNLRIKEDIGSRGRIDQLVTLSGNMGLAMPMRGTVEVRWFAELNAGRMTLGTPTMGSTIAFYEERKFEETNLQFQHPILSSSRLDHFTPRTIVGVMRGEITTLSRIDHINAIKGDLRLDGVGEMEGEADHTKPENYIDVVYVEGHYRMFGDPIRSVGVASVVNILEGDFGSGSILTESTTLATTVVDGELQSGDITLLGGRLTFGDDDHERVDQIYEVSNDRSMDIRECVPDPSYAVRLNTTDYDITGEELRRGTATFEFHFDHDISDIKQINVWLRNALGQTKIDTMRWNDRRYNNKAPHVLYEPFRNNKRILRVPVHCIAPKENEFFIEIVYIENDNGVSLARPRAQRERESYIIPFQAHFDNHNPYVNIADHSRMEAYGGRAHCRVETDEPKMTMLPLADQIHGLLTGTVISGFRTESDVPFLTDFRVEDHIILTMNGGLTYLYRESDDLYNINIGG